MLIIHSRRSLTNRHVNIWHIIILICTCLTLIAYESSFAAPETITTFPSPYMNAVNTELATVDNGAAVGADTKAYWDLHPDAPERASYDADIVVEVADGVWTIGTAGLVNSHVVRAPEGLITFPIPFTTGRTTRL